MNEKHISRRYHVRRVNGVRMPEHRRIVEEVLGCKLPEAAVVHHVNGDKLDNRKENLAVFPSREYHNYIHARIDAMEVTGDPAKRRCEYCHEYDSLGNMTVTVRGRTYHKICAAKYVKLRRERAKL